MSDCMFEILYPWWVGIAFNVAMTFLHIACPFRVNDHGRLRWYWRGNNGPIFMGAVWAALLLWSLTNGLAAC